VPVLAAASVAVVAMVGVLMLPDRSSSRGPVAGTGELPPYVVRDGARVEVTGLVVAEPGRPVVYCPPLPSPSMPDDGPPGCRGSNFAVTLTGVDLDRLAEPGTKDGVRFGYARLRGIWHERSIAVDQQSMPANARDGSPDNDPVPCPEPPGGWPAPPGHKLPSAVAVQRYAEQHPQRFGATWVAFPNGLERPTAAMTVPVVLVVSLLHGDVDQARRELRPLYDGALCISPGNITRARLTTAAYAAQSLLFDTRNGIWESSGVGPTAETTATEGPIEVHLLVVDQRLYGEFHKIGLDLLALHPAIRPIR
jgi:hypothetical protein